MLRRRTPRAKADYIATTTHSRDFSIQQVAMKYFRNWFAAILASGKKEKDIAAAQRNTAAAHRRDNKPESIEFRDRLGKTITGRDDSQHQSARKRYVREDTGTHETLTIIDESLLQNDDKDGIDPYNSGQFDRSKSWNSLRFRK